MPLPTTRANVIRLYKMNFLNENTSFSWSSYTELIENLDRECYGSPIQFETFNLIYEQDEIRVYMSYENAILYDYMLIGFYDENKQVQKWLCCYITNVNLINKEVVGFKIKLDTFTTFYNEFNVMGLLERVHSPRTILNPQDTSQVLINKDLFFAEDSPSINYKPKYINKLPTTNNCNYVLITFAIPVSALQDKSVVLDGITFEYQCYEDENTHCQLCDLIAKGDQTGTEHITIFNTKGMFGKTTLTNIILTTEPSLSKTSSTYGMYYTTNVSAFFKKYPTLQDKIINCVMLPPFYDLTDFRNYFACLDGFIFDVGDIGINYINDIRLLDKYIDITSYMARFTNHGSYNDEDMIYDDYYDEEPKLKLYPYSYYKLHVYNDEVIYKYQDFDFYDLTSIGETSCHIDLFASPISALFLKTYDKYDGNFTISDGTYFDKVSATCVSLPSLSIFESQYNQYRNYQEAIVDSHLLFSGINATMDVGMGIASAVALGGMVGVAGEVLKTPQLAQTSYALSSAKSGGGAIGSIINFAEQAQQVELNEQQLKRKPPIERGQMTNQSSFFIDVDTYGRMESRFFFMELNENEIYTYYNKFYYYGYYTPVAVNTKVIAFSTTPYFEVLFESRTRFNYVKFRNCIVQGNFASIYQKDIEQRLVNGITTFHSASDRPIEYDKYGTYYNDEVSKFKVLQHPLFAKE